MRLWLEADMNTGICSAAILLALAVSHGARADTFTWAGNDGDFSDAASWSGPAPTPGGSPTDQLIFPVSLAPSGLLTATVDLPESWKVNTLAIGSSDSSPPAPTFPITINSVASASLLFCGPGATISVASQGPATIDAPIVSNSDLTFSGDPIALTNSLSFQNSSNLLVHGYVSYQNDSPPTGLNQLIVSPDPAAPNSSYACFDWGYTPTDNLPLVLSFGAGAIVLDNASFEFDCPSNSPPSIDITNPLIIRNAFLLASAPDKPVRFTGSISLQGSLDIDSVNNAITLSGRIMLDQSGGDAPALDAGNSDSFATSITGNIVDDPDPSHAAALPLNLSGPYSTVSANAGLRIEGPANTYSTGTIIQYGNVFVAPGSSLGTGPVTVYENAVLHLSAPTNLAPGRAVFLRGQSSTLAISFDQDPSSLLDPTSQGSLALDTTFSTPLNLATLGNGLMSLGSTNNSTYIAASLAPDSDHVYRFSSTSNSTLTVANSVLRDYNGIPSRAQLAGVTLAAPNSYSGGTIVNGEAYAAAPGALGSGDITIGGISDPSGSGILTLTAPDAYASTAHVDVYGSLAAAGISGAIPGYPNGPVLHPGSALILGDNLTNNSDRYPDALPLYLNASTFVLRGFGPTSETVGPISISGLATIVLWNAPAPTPAETLLNLGNGSTATTPATVSSTTLIAPGLTRDDHAVLFLVPFYIPPNTSTFTSGAYPTTPDGDCFQLLSPPTVTNGMVAPWLQSRSVYNGFITLTSPSSFLSYNSSGFVPTAYTSLPTTGGTGTEIVDIPAGPANAITLSADCSIYALRTAASILNPSATLHILSGGLIAAASSPFPIPQIRIEPNVDFANAEAFINVDGEFNPFAPNTLEISGVVTAFNGLTKFGGGDLRLSNPNDQILGPITVHEGTLELAALPDPASATPITLSSATLTFLSSTTLSRPVIVSKGSNLYSYGTTIQTAPGQSLAVTGPVTGDGDLYMSAGNSLRVAVPLSLNLVSLSAGEICLDAPITAPAISLNAPSIHLATSLSTQNLSLWGDPDCHLTGAGTITSTTALGFSRVDFSPGDNPGDRATIIFDAPATDVWTGITFECDLTSTGICDRLLFTGDFTIKPYDATNPYDSPSILALNFLDPPTGDIYTLVSAASISGTFSSVTGLPEGYSVDYTADSILLVPTPEPGTLGIFALACGGLVCRRRRCR